MFDKVTRFRRMMFEWYYEGIELIFNLVDKTPPKFLYYDWNRWEAEWGESSEGSL